MKNALDVTSRLIDEIPEGSRKFVQGIINGHSFFALSPIGFSDGHYTHSNILSRVLADNGISPEYMRGEVSNSVPKAEGENYKVVGMGVLSRRGEFLNLWDDESADYRMGPNKEHFELLRDELNKRSITKIIFK